MKIERILLALIALHLPVRGLAEADGPSTVKTVMSDTKRMITSPLRLNRDDMKVILGAGAVIVGVSLFDEEIRRRLFPTRNTDSSEDMRLLGDKGQLLGPVLGTAFAIHGFATGDEKSKETALLSYESFALAGAATGILKFAIGRERPSKTGEQYRFSFAKGDSSFPSGHTTVAFAAATVFAEQYPSMAVAIPAYGIASAIGFSRMSANKHWASDVVAGAIIGTTVAHSLRLWHIQSKDKNQSFEVDMDGMRWTHKF